MNSRCSITTMLRLLCLCGIIITLLSSVAPEALCAVPHTPTTDHNPFEKIDIYSDRNSCAGNLDHLTKYYPELLADPNLLLIRLPSDTVAVAASYVNDYTEIETVPSAIGYVEYKVDPPRFASSIYLLTMARDVFSGSDNFDDNGQQILNVTTTHESGRTNSTMLNVGEDIRAYMAANLCDEPLYFMPPSSPLSWKIWSGVIGSHYRYFDAHEIPIPQDLKNDKVVGIWLESQYEWAPCISGGFTFHAGNFINGVSVGSKFHAYRPDGTAVVTQSQNIDIPYGGYYYGGEVVGEFGTIAEQGCALTCCSMLLNYYGTPCTPQDLNLYLQNNRGYTRYSAGVIDIISGQAVGDLVHLTLTKDARFEEGNRVLVEHGAYSNPVASLEFLETVPEGGTGAWLRIYERYISPDIIEMNDRVLVSGDVSHAKAVTYNNGQPKYIPYDTGLEAGHGIVASTEQAFVDSMPCMLHTRIIDGRATHWVVADGMEPRYRPDTGDHRGTYTVHNPGDPSTETLLNTYNNEYTSSIIAQPYDNSKQIGSIIVITVCGGTDLRVMDPLGRSVYYDAESDTYISEISDCIAVRNPMRQPGVLPSLDGACVEIWNAQDGDYGIEVIGESSGAYGISITGHDPSGAVKDWDGWGASTAGGSTYYIAHYSTQSGVPISVDETTSIESNTNNNACEEIIINAPNPYQPGSDIKMLAPFGKQAEISVYDIRGRLVINLYSGELINDQLVVRWDGKTESGTYAPSGVYCVQARVGNLEAKKTVVLVK